MKKLAKTTTRNSARKLSRWYSLPALGMLAAAMAIGGCSRHDEASATPDSIAARAAQRTDEIQANASKTLDDAKQAAHDTTQDVKQAANEVAERVNDKVADAVITTTVNAELAKDSTLSATKIDVDTDAGRVALRGTAPDQASRDRATQLAMAVRGVVNVDNQLKIDNKM